MGCATLAANRTHAIHTTGLAAGGEHSTPGTAGVQHGPPSHSGVGARNRQPVPHCRCPFHTADSQPRRRRRGPPAKRCRHGNAARDPAAIFRHRCRRHARAVAVHPRSARGWCVPRRGQCNARERRKEYRAHPREPRFESSSCSARASDSLCKRRRERPGGPYRGTTWRVCLHRCGRGTDAIWPRRRHVYWINGHPPSCPLAGLFIGTAHIFRSRWPNRPRAVCAVWRAGRFSRRGSRAEVRLRPAVEILWHR